MIFDILTLFPDMCETVLSESVIGRARAKGLLSAQVHNIRDYTTDKHNRVDDLPYGGGRGMVMQVQPVADCIKAITEMRGKRPRVIYLSPKGRVFNQGMARELLGFNNIALLCGHYEGVDQRIIDNYCDMEISIGDFVLTGGELPALCVVDAVARMLTGVLPENCCFEDESHYSGLLEYPHYTRPAEYEGHKVPEILLSGNHKKIEEWRAERSLEITKRLRPDLLEFRAKEDKL